ncbi:hypothetical protein JCM6882_002560 [Rhodosporidiobolus microsporus]
MSNSDPHDSQQQDGSLARNDRFDSSSPAPSPSATPPASTPLQLKALEARSSSPPSSGIDVLSLLKKSDDRRLFAPSPAPTYRTSAASPPPPPAPVHLRRSSSLRPPLPPLPPSRQNSTSSAPSMASMALHHHPHAPAPASVVLEEEEEEALESPSDSLARWTTASSGRSRRGSDTRSLAMSSFGDLSATAGMTDAEIAQHHFRLAQQHLEAAQRMALAAASRASRPPPSAPSSVFSPPSIIGGALPREDYAESVIDPDELPHSPRSTGSTSTVTATGGDAYSGASSEFGRLSITDVVDASSDKRRSRSLSSLHPSAQAPHPVPSPSSAYPASTRSVPVRASSIAKRAVNTTAPAHPPLPPQRRRSSPPREDEPTPAQAYALAQQQAPLQQQLSQLEMEDDDLVGSSDGEHRDSREQARNFFFDDAASEFGGDESTFSHVTNATLPPYELGYGGGGYGAGGAVPPVPPLPARFAAEAAASAPPPATSTASSPNDDSFHGFRPRLAVVQPSYTSTPPSSPSGGPRTVVNAPSPYASHPYSASTTSLTFTNPRPAPAPAHAPHPQAYIAPQVSTAHLQPHSYILGPNGQPIPVYASPAAVPPPQPSAPPHRHTLPIHAQPLHFDPHTLPYSHAITNSARPPPSPAPVYTQGHASSAYASSPQTLHPSHSTASFTPSAHSSASSSVSTLPTPTVSFTLASAPPARAPSTSGFSDSSSSSNHTTATSSTGMKGRMASLRAKVGGGGGPRVRFKSPSPEGAKQRAMGMGLMSGVGEVVDEEKGEKNGGGGEVSMDKQRKGLQMSMSMLL